MINNNNLQQIKNLTDRIEYTVTKTEKEASITPIYEQFADDLYEEDMQELYRVLENDIIAVYNKNTRDYGNIFTDKKYINNGLDLKRCKLTPKEQNEVIDQYIDLEYKDYLYIEFEDDTTEKQKETIKKKILDNIIIDEITARGYFQGDWDEYIIVSYNDISKENNETLQSMLKNIKYLFTVQEYSVTLTDIETRLYTSGVEQVERIETDSYSFVSYDGYTDKEEAELIKQGYTIIN